MSEIQRKGDLEIGEDIEYQQRSWTIERVGWVGMALIVLAALLGLFGDGLVSKAKAGKENSSLWMDYDRFGRIQTPTKLRLHLGANASKDDRVRVWLSGDYLENVEITQVTPQPAIVESRPDGPLYVFQKAGVNGSVTVTFYLEPEKIGSLAGKVGILEGEQIDFHQFIYP